VKLPFQDTVPQKQDIGILLYQGNQVLLDGKSATEILPQ
jgi:hypothetical protein